MSKRSTPAPAPDPEDEAPEPQDSVIEEIAAICAEVGGESLVSLFRRAKGGHPNGAFLSSWAVAEFSAQRVADEFGGGVYNLVFKGADNQIVKRAVLSVDESVKPKARKEEAAADALKPLREELAAMRAQLGAPRESRSLADYAPVITACGAILTPIILKCMDKPAPVVSGQTAGLKELVELMGFKNDSMTTAFEIAKQLRAMQPEPSAGGESEPSLGRALIEALPAAIEAFARAKGAAAAAPVLVTQPALHNGTPDNQPQGGNGPVVEISPAHNGGTAAAVAPPPPAAAPSDELHAILESAVRGAERDGDVASYANVIEDQLAEMWPVVEAALRKPTWFEDVFGNTARVVRVKPWLERLRAELLAEPEAEPAPAASRVQTSGAKR